MERVISLKSWLGAVFRKWRWMLAIALILGILLGGREALSIRASRVAARAAAAQQNSEESESTRQARSVYNEAMSEIDDNVSKRNAYITESLKTQIIPTEEGKATVNLYLRTDALERDQTSSVEEVQASNTSQGTEVTYMTPALRKANQILDGYAEFIKNQIDWTDLADQMGTKTEYIQELLTVSAIDESNVKLTIAVIHPNEEGAEQILNELIDQVNGQKDAMTEKFGQHEIEFRNQQVNTVVDNTLMRWLSDRVSDVNTLIVAQDNYKVNMSSTQQQETTVVEQSHREIFVSCAKKALTGFAAGLAAFILIYGIYLIASKRLLSGKDFNEQYGLRKLAAVPDAKLQAKRGLDRLAAGPVRQYYTGSTEDDAYRIAAETIGQVAPGQKKIGVLGDLKDEELKRICGKLQKAEKDEVVSFCLLKDLSQDPDSLAALRECESTILVAKMYDSRYNRVDEILSVLKTYQKQIIGSVIV